MRESADHVGQWRRSHGATQGQGGRLVVAWLRAVHRLAVPLARLGVSPDALTVAGLALAVAAVPVAAAGGRWPALAAALVVACSVADGLDGAVARLRSPSEQVRRWGAVLDAATDRLTEVAFGLVLWAIGAPAWLAVTAVAACWWLEYLRERVSSTVPQAPLVLTVGERPTRVIVTAMFALAAAAVPGLAGVLATCGAAVLGACAVIGVVQLVVSWGRLPR